MGDVFRERKNETEGQKGYLAYDQTTSEVYIPNMETREEFRLAVEGAQWDDVVQMIKQSEELLKATWNGEADKVWL